MANEKLTRMLRYEGGIKMKLDITLFGALPFRRISKTAKRQRRTHLKKDAPTVATCSNCGAPLAPHRACTKCGYYKGKEAIKVNKDEK
jgi:large subunit ribosomal protein L32